MLLKIGRSGDGLQNLEIKHAEQAPHISTHDSAHDGLFLTSENTTFAPNLAFLVTHAGKLDHIVTQI